jgi:hypothetical protein
MIGRGGCGRCGADLEQWSRGPDLWITFCPRCGAEVGELQRYELHRKTTIDAVSDMIQGRIFDMFDDRNGERINAEDLATLSWGREQCDGVVFYSDYDADLFVARHLCWVDEAFDFLCDFFGLEEYYRKMRSECYDRFLVEAFSYATEYYVFGQLGVDRSEGVLTEERIGEIKRLMQMTPYDGTF